MLRRYLLSLALLALVVAVWQITCSLGLVDRLILASPADVAGAIGRDGRLLLDNARVTLIEVLLGLGLALLFGAGAGLAMHLSRVLRDAAYPLLIASQAIPIVVVAPLLVLAFDYGIGAKVAIVALICFFPVTVGTLDGLRSADPDLLKLMRSLGASRTATLVKVEIPGALPSLFSGLRVAATVSVIGAVFGEWAGSENGLGRLVLLGTQQLQTPRAYAGVLLLTVMALLLFSAVALTERVALPWRRTGGAR